MAMGWLLTPNWLLVKRFQLQFNKERGIFLLFPLLFTAELTRPKVSIEVVWEVQGGASSLGCGWLLSRLESLLSYNKVSNQATCRIPVSCRIIREINLDILKKSA